MAVFSLPACLWDGNSVTGRWGVQSTKGTEDQQEGVGGNANSLDDGSVALNQWQVHLPTERTFGNVWK